MPTPVEIYVRDSGTGANRTLATGDLTGATAAFAFEEVTVSTTAVGFTEATYDDATLAVCQVTGASIRVRYDGGDPTTTSGVQVILGADGTASFTVTGAENIAAFRMIRDDAADATVAATFEH